MVAADSDTLCVHGLWMPPADLSELSGLSHVFSDLSFAFWKQKDVDEPKKNKGWNILKGVCWSGAQTSAHIQKMSRFNDLESDRCIRHHENRTTSVSRTASGQDHVRGGRHANNVAGKSHFQWNQGLYICSVVRCESYMMRPVRY